MTTNAPEAAPWWRILGRYAAPHRPALVSILLLQFLLAAVNAATPWPLKLIVDHVLPGKALPTGLGWVERLAPGGSANGLLVLLAVGTIVLFLLRQLLVAVQNVAQTTTGRQMSYALAEDTLDQLYRRPLARLSRHPRGDLLSRLDRDARSAEQLVFGVVLAAVGAVANLALMAVVMVRLDAALAALSLVTVLPVWWLIHHHRRTMTTLAEGEATSSGALLGGVERVLDMVPEVQAFTAEDREQRQVRALAGGWHHAGLAVQSVFVRFDLGVGFATGAGTAGLLGVGGLLVLQDRVTVGALLVFVSYLAALYAPLNSLAYLATTYAEARAGGQRVLELWGQEPVIADPADPVALPSAAPAGARVELVGVTVGYEADRPVLRNLDLVIEPGQAVAVTGLSGAGKTTLACLLARFLDPWDGQVRLDGVDLRHARVHDVRRRVALVFQDSVLLPASIADNISYGRPDATFEQIQAAARAANAHEFICELPQGYDTVLGEGGSTLSGGQRQRLAIARAFLKDAPLLVLDEPTSALDGESEALIVDALRSITRHRTVILISHRLSTIQHVDRIVTLHNGIIIADRPPHERTLEPSGGR